MKVAILVPPSPFLYEPLTFVPLGPLYLSAYLKRQGHEIVVYDYNDQRGRFDYKWNKIEKADFIGITGTTPQFKDMVKILDFIKQHDYEKNKLFIVGGPHASVDPKSCLDAGFHTVIVGDGEYAFEDVLKNKTKIPALQRNIN